MLLKRAISRIQLTVISLGLATAVVLGLIRIIDPNYLKKVDVTVTQIKKDELIFGITVNQESVDIEVFWAEVTSPLKQSDSYSLIQNTFRIKPLWYFKKGDWSYSPGESFEIDLKPDFTTYCNYIFNLGKPYSSSLVADNHEGDTCELEIYFHNDGIKDQVSQTIFQCKALVNQLIMIEQEWHAKNQVEDLFNNCRP